MTSRTGEIGIGDRRLFAHAVFLDTGNLLIRMAPDEWDRLGVAEGMRLKVTLPGEKPRDMWLEYSHWHEPGWQWLTFSEPTRRAPSRVTPAAVGDVR